MVVPTSQATGAAIAVQKEQAYEIRAHSGRKELSSGKGAGNSVGPRTLSYHLRAGNVPTLIKEGRDTHSFYF